MSAFRLPALAAVLAAAGLCAAAAPGVGRLESPVRHEILSCDKNHYILDEPCAFPATEFPIGYVGAVAVDPLGQVHFSSPHIVYRIDSKGLLIRVAGTGSPGFSGDGGPARDAQLNFPQWYPERENDPMDWSELLGPLAFDPAGNLYIGDAYNHRVRRVDVRAFEYDFGQIVARIPRGGTLIEDEVDSAGRVEREALEVELELQPERLAEKCH